MSGILNKSIFLFFFVVICTFSILAQNHFEKELFIAQTDTLPYNILKPVDYLLSSKNKQEKTIEQKKYPLILFLHGAGERGVDNNHIGHIKRIFLDSTNRFDFQSFVIAPQCPKGKRWVEVAWSAKSHLIPAEPSWALQNTMILLGRVLKDYPIDSSRIYITGLSMGGYGTWDAISRYPNFFAAAVPICGGGDENMAEDIKEIPIWAFHGSNDKVVSVSRTRNMIEAIQKSGGNPKYTEYKGVGHGSWVKAYMEKDLLKWLFAQYLE